MTQPPAPPPDPDSLCDHCANQPECDQHHQMCVNFEPKAEPSDTPSPDPSALDGWRSPES